MSDKKFTVRPGDIFRDKDSRMDGRHLKVIAVEGLYARCVNCDAYGAETYGHTRISLHGLETRFERVGGSTQVADLERAALAALKAWRKAGLAATEAEGTEEFEKASALYWEKFRTFRSAADALLAQKDGEG